MRAVIDMLTQMGAQPLEQLPPTAARAQPGLHDAVSALAQRAGVVPADDGLRVEDVIIPHGPDDLQGRLYRPADLLPRLNPMIVYFHGGGFVTGDLESHDSAARALAWRSGAIVLSVAYRLVPEHGLPAAHDDAWAAWQWLSAQAHKLGGDPRRVAVAGEDAGGNLAVHVSLRARQERGHRPVHQLLIHPMAGTDLSLASYGETLRVQPFGASAMRWRLRQIFPEGIAEHDTPLHLAERSDLANLPSTTIVLAQIDPLRSEGEALATALQQAGVSITGWVCEGVSQGFFGLGQIVTKALFAQADVATALRKAFAGAVAR